jgi:hypothetical protein
MNYFPSDKYNLAWFKLAECVARGEKERALGVYRLLSHSIADQAYSLQLEGDLLLAFKDELAYDKYRSAIAWYHKENRLQEATAIGEHMALLCPHDSEVVELLLSLYQNLESLEKICHYGGVLVDIFINSQQLEKIEPAIQKYAAPLTHINKTRLYKEVVRRYVCNKHGQKDVGVALLHILLLFLIDAHNESELYLFLDELETLHQDYYQEACAFIR